MAGNFGRRLIDLVVLFLAAYAFAFVPLGNRTALEHCRAILRTRAAHEAGHDIAVAADRLRRHILDSDDDHAIPGRGGPVVPSLPRKSHEPIQAAIAPMIVDPPDASM